MQTLRMPGLPSFRAKACRLYGAVLAARISAVSAPVPVSDRAIARCIQMQQTQACKISSMRAALLQHVSWSSHLLHLFQGPSPPLSHAQMSRHPQDISEIA